MADTPLAVTRAAFSIQSPSTQSSTELALVKADIQPSGQSADFPRSFAIESATPVITPRAITLVWQQGTLSITVGTAIPVLTPYNVAGEYDVSRDTGTISFAGSSITLTLASGSSFTLPVDKADLSPTSFDVIGEEAQNFGQAQFAFSGSDVGLRKGIPVLKADPSFTGSDVALTLLANSAITVVPAAFSIVGQDITLTATWVLPVTEASFSIVGKSITLDWTIDNGVVVVAAEPGAVGLGAAPVSFGMNVATTFAAPSIAGSSITLAQSQSFFLEVGPNEDILLIDGSDIGLSFTRTLEIVTSPAQPSLHGNVVQMFLGDGRPAIIKIKATFDSDHIEISFSKPLASIRTLERKVG